MIWITWGCSLYISRVNNRHKICININMASNWYKYNNIIMYVTSFTPARQCMLSINYKFSEYRVSQAAEPDVYLALPLVSFSKLVYLSMITDIKHYPHKVSILKYRSNKWLIENRQHNRIIVIALIITQNTELKLYLQNETHHNDLLFM